jgi:predicted metal-dependent phosphotriesterase family hydrolase
VAHGFLRTVGGDITVVPDGYVYSHEHLIIDSPLIADRFAAIHLDDVESAVSEVAQCAHAGAALMVDTMPCSAGRDVVRLREISERTGVAVIAATGLHHDRYYGPLHWSNRVEAETLADLFVADLLEGIDTFDYTGPVVRRDVSKAGVVKVATSGPNPDLRDERNLKAAATASVRTGAPVITHCEGGLGGSEQVELLTSYGVPPSSIILSHVDKSHDFQYLSDLAASGVYLECDQILKHFELGAGAIAGILALIDAGHAGSLVVGTDGARKALWSSHGGKPGLAWLAARVPELLKEAGVDAASIGAIMRDNAIRAFSWREVA